MKANINKEDIDKTVADVCIQIIKEPLSYFSEADIQQLLVEELRKIKPLSKLHPTAVQKGKDSKGTFSTSLLHREYGGGEGTRIDAVILDPDDVKKINDPNLTTNKKYLDPVYAFELGTEKTSDTFKHVKNDVGKLSKCVKKKNGAGYLIHFYKDNTQARTGTNRRNNTEEKIERLFKQAFNDIKIITKQAIGTEQANKYENVKILAILLRTYRDQKKMRGKCRIFNGQKWIPVNISRYDSLRKAILSQLGYCASDY